ncbi:MAG: DUF4160 domain-containing protein [Microcystaceae cyanobacterium]
MATVLRKDGFSVRIYTNDHLPSHVHVFKAGGEAKINLGDETQYPNFVTISTDMSNKDARKALELVTQHQLFLLKKWREIHGIP